MFRCEVPPWAVKLPALTSCKSKRCWYLQGELWRIQTSKCATWKSLLSSHPNLEKPHKLPLEMPQFLTFKIPENLLFCFCAYPEVLSLGKTDEKCFILTEVHRQSLPPRGSAWSGILRNCLRHTSEISVTNVQQWLLLSLKMCTERPHVWVFTQLWETQI